MTRAGVRHLPIVEGTRAVRLVGVLAASDACRILGEQLRMR